jgi:predicted aspartyl protease
MILRTVLLLLCLALANCAGGNFGGACGLHLAGEAPLGLSSNIPLVEMAVGDARVALMVDTGSMRTVIRPAAVKRLGLAMVEGGAHQLLGTNGPTVAQVAVLNGALVGGATLEEIKVPVPPDSDVAFLGSVGGVLGMDVLGKYEVDLDLPARRMRLYTGSPCDGETLPLGASVQNIRGQWTHQIAYNNLDPRVFVRGTFDGHEVAALLDSGAQRSALYADLAASLGVTATMLAQDSTIQISGAGTTKVRASRHTVRELRFGDAVLANWEVWVMPRADTNDAAMVLGADYLATHRIWLAPKRRGVFVTATSG